MQVRPALFPVTRNPTLSLANHKEILGDPPSPWTVGAMVEGGREVMRHFAAVDPAVAEWDEVYAVELAERVWMNFSTFFRLFGDSDGSGRVDTIDFIAFRNAFNGGPSSIFDFDNSGNVQTSDFIRFRNAFNTTP